MRFTLIALALLFSSSLCMGDYFFSNNFYWTLRSLSGPTGNAAVNWENGFNWSNRYIPTSTSNAWFGPCDYFNTQGICGVTVNALGGTVANVIYSNANYQKYSLRTLGNLTVTDGFYVAGGLVDAYTTYRLGSNDVTIPFGGSMINTSTTYISYLYLNSPCLTLNSASNIAPGKKLYVGSTLDGNGQPLLNGMAVLNGSVDPSGFIAPASTGTIALAGTSNTSTFTAVGNCFLGASLGNTVYAGTSLPAGTDGIYRFGGTGFLGGSDSLKQQLYIGQSGAASANVVTGDHDVLVWNGGVRFFGDNDYTGKTIVRQNSNPLQWSSCPLTGTLSSATGSPFGSATGDVVLQQGVIVLDNTDGRKTFDASVSKGCLSFEGESTVALNKNSNELDFTFASVERKNRGILHIQSTATGVSPDLGIVASDGKASRILVTDSSSIPVTNGMAPAFYISAASSSEGSFLNYVPGSGFVKIRDADMTPLPSSGGDGTKLALVSHSTTLAGNVNVWALKLANDVVIAGGYQVTIGSGGLIMVHNSSTWLQQGGNYVFGASGNQEGIIYTPGNCGWGACGTWISGTVTANGLTKAGPGNLYMTANNVGILTGKTVVNAGILYADTNALGGDSGGAVVLNGGAFAPTETTCLKSIAVGPIGGILGDGRTGIPVRTINKPIVDDPAFGAPGALTLVGTLSLRERNTFTGPLVIQGSVDLNQDVGTSGGTPGLGSLIIEGPAGKLVDYAGQGWSLPGRVSLLGTGTQLSFERETSSKTWSFGSLEGTGNIVTGGYEHSIFPTIEIGSDDSSSDFFGTISEALVQANTPCSITKQGKGVLTLWGDNTWHGATTVDEGTLRINGSLRNGATMVGQDITINGGTLDGRGILVRNIVVNPHGRLAGLLSIQGNIDCSGTVSPGNGVGTLTVKGNVSLSGSSVLEFDFGAPGAGGTNDLINVLGNLLIDGTLEIHPAGTLAVGTYRLFDYTGTLTDQGLSILQPDPSKYLCSVSVDTLAGDVNMVVTPAPEPGTMSLLVLASLTMLRRRKK